LRKAPACSSWPATIRIEPRRSTNYLIAPASRSFASSSGSKPQSASASSVC
jgi:hypothetical protein